VPTRIGSALSGAPPTKVSEVKLKQGTAVTLLDNSQQTDQDGSIWLPILPPPQDVRYIPASAVAAVNPVSATSSIPGGPTTVQAAANPLMLQAQQAEAARDYPKAVQLYSQLGREVNATDHDLSLWCHNRAVICQQQITGSVPANYQPGVPNQASYGGAPPGMRMVPAPTYYNPCPSGYRPAAMGTSQYCYQPDGKQPATANKPAQVTPQMHMYGPGELRLAAFYIDNKKAYVLQTPQGMIYATAAQPGVVLDPYLNRRVKLSGAVIYRGDLKKDYMTVNAVIPE